MKIAKDLTKEPPRSPRMRLGGYALLARMVDKGRASLNGTAGEYHFACPLDQMLFGFKGVTAEQVEPVIASNATDDDIVKWFDTHGTPKTSDEIKTWSQSVEAARPYENPEKRDWFAGECARLGLKPEKTTLFDMLEEDDRATFKRS